MKAEIVERANSIAYDLVGQFADGFADERVRFRKIRSRQFTGHANGSFFVQIEHNAAFDVTSQPDLRGYTFAPVGFLFHGEVTHRGGRLQHLRKNGIRGVDEGLNQLHFHA